MPIKQHGSSIFDRLGFIKLDVTPNPVQIAIEAALWGSVQSHKFLCDAVVLSDDAGQFNVGHHALCRVGGDVAAPTPHSPDVQISRIRFFMRELRSG